MGHHARFEPLFCQPFKLLLIPRVRRRPGAAEWPWWFAGADTPGPFAASAALVGSGSDPSCTPSTAWQNALNIGELGGSHAMSSRPGSILAFFTRLGGEDDRRMKSLPGRFGMIGAGKKAICSFSVISSPLIVFMTSVAVLGLLGSISAGFFVRNPISVP